MDRFAAYSMFLQVADRGSFTLAARALRVSPQAVTRGVAGLEAHLCVSLFHRSTRSVALTAEGEALLPRIRRLLEDLGEYEREASGAQAEPRGTLAVTAPVMFGRLHVLPVVNALVARHSRLDVSLLLHDRNVRMAEEGLDVAVRIGTPADSVLRLVRIGSVRQVIVASPDYLSKRGTPSSQQDLSRHDLIASTGPRASHEWPNVGRRREGPRARLSVNTVDAALAAAEAGIGLANLLSYQVADALAAGRLVEVLPNDQPEAIPVNLLIDPGRAQSAATRAFVDAVRERAKAGAWG